MWFFKVQNDQQKILDLKETVHKVDWEYLLTNRFKAGTGFQTRNGEKKLKIS